MMKHILIVDDDKTNLIATKNALNDNYKVIAVSSGPQALKFLENNTCDLILLDINMPEMSGFEVVKRLREKNAQRQIPIIFLTANQDRGSVTEGIRLGVHDYIAKPFVYTELCKRVERVLARNNVQLSKEEQYGYLSGILADLKENRVSQAISKLETALEFFKQ